MSAPIHPKHQDYKSFLFTTTTWTTTPYSFNRYSRRITTYTRRTGSTKTTNSTNHIIVSSSVLANGTLSFKTVDGRTSSSSLLLSSLSGIFSRTVIQSSGDEISQYADSCQ